MPDEIPPQAPLPESPSRFKNPNTLRAIIAGLAVLVVVLAATIVYLWPKKANNLIDQTPQTNNNATSSSGGEVAKDTIDQKDPETFITVDWLPEWQLMLKNENNNTDIELAGTVRDGQYAGKKVYIQVEYGLGTSFNHFILETEGKLESNRIILASKNIKIRGIDDLPGSIAFPGSSYKLSLYGFRSFKFSELTIVRKVFTDPKVGDVYLADNGCLVVELPDHTTVSYDFDLPFISSENRKLSATFFEGLQNLDPYSFNKIVGCNALCYYMAVVDETTLKPFQRLVEVGNTSNGEKLYGIKDPRDKVLLDLYNDKNTMPYYDEGYQTQSKSKYTYEQFLSYRPLLYWVDPLGRWIEFKNDRFQYAAEMCKPVIYLYPKFQTDVTVRVSPNGGFTYSNPLYGQGWQVTAYPSGKIVEKQSGKEYPYLFWEGIGLNYPQQNSGFVISTKMLDTFFNQKLPLLGLNNREAQDFKDYWIGRLTGLSKPYVKISFLKKEQFDELAPLEVSPIKPNSVIRVMMTAKGLDNFEHLPTQELPIPSERKGFTLVEWGGAVLK